MELIKEFGVDPYLLIAQIVNFLIIFYLLKRFAYKPILGILKNREETIKEGLKQAEESRRLLESTTQREQEILRKARAEAKALLDETRAQQDLMLKEAEATTKQQVEKMLSDARAQIATDRQKAESELTAHAVELAIAIVQKAVPQVLTDKDQESAVKKVTQTLKKKVD